MEVGHVFWSASIDLADVEKQIAQLQKKVSNIKFDISPQAVNKINQTYGKLNTVTIKPKVDHTPLTELNKHLDIKLKHYKNLQKHFDSNPLRIQFIEENVDKKRKSKSQNTRQGVISDKNIIVVNLKNEKQINLLSELLKSNNEFSSDYQKITKDTNQSLKSILGLGQKFLSQNNQNLKEINKSTRANKPSVVGNIFSTMIGNNLSAINSSIFSSVKKGLQETLKITFPDIFKNLDVYSEVLTKYFLDTSGASVLLTNAFEKVTNKITEIAKRINLKEFLQLESQIKEKTTNKEKSQNKELDSDTADVEYIFKLIDKRAENSAKKNTIKQTIDTKKEEQSSVLEKLSTLQKANLSPSQFTSENESLLAEKSKLDKEIQALQQQLKTINNIDFTEIESLIDFSDKNTLAETLLSKTNKTRKQQTSLQLKQSELIVKKDANKKSIQAIAPLDQEISKVFKQVKEDLQKLELNTPDSEKNTEDYLQKSNAIKESGGAVIESLEKQKQILLDNIQEADIKLSVELDKISIELNTVNDLLNVFQDLETELVSYIGKEKIANKLSSDAIQLQKLRNAKQAELQKVKEDDSLQTIAKEIEDLKGLKNIVISQGEEDKQKLDSTTPEGQKQSLQIDKEVSLVISQLTSQIKELETTYAQQAKLLETEQNILTRQIQVLRQNLALNSQKQKAVALPKVYQEALQIASQGRSVESMQNIPTLKPLSEDVLARYAEKGASVNGVYLPTKNEIQLSPELLNKINQDVPLSAEEASTLVHEITHAINSLTGIQGIDPISLVPETDQEKTHIEDFLKGYGKIGSTNTEILKTGENSVTVDEQTAELNALRNTERLLNQQRKRQLLNAYPGNAVISENIQKQVSNTKNIDLGSLNSSPEVIDSLEKMTKDALIIDELLKDINDIIVKISLTEDTQKLSKLFSLVDKYLNLFDAKSKNISRISNNLSSLASQNNSQDSNDPWSDNENTAPLNNATEINQGYNIRDVLSFPPFTASNIGNDNDINNPVVDQAKTTQKLVRQDFINLTESLKSLQISIETLTSNLSGESLTEDNISSPTVEILDNNQDSSTVSNNTSSQLTTYQKASTTLSTVTKGLQAFGNMVQKTGNLVVGAVSPVYKTLATLESAVMPFVPYGQLIKNITQTLAVPAIGGLALNALPGGIGAGAIHAAQSGAHLLTGMGAEALTAGLADAVGSIPLIGPSLMASGSGLIAGGADVLANVGGAVLAGGAAGQVVKNAVSYPVKNVNKNLLTPYDWEVSALESSGKNKKQKGLSSSKESGNLLGQAKNVIDSSIQSLKPAKAVTAELLPSQQDNSGLLALPSANSNKEIIKQLNKILTADGIKKLIQLSNANLGTNFKTGDKNQNLQAIASSVQAEDIMRLAKGQLSDLDGNKIILPNASTSGKTKYRKQGTEITESLPPVTNFSQINSYIKDSTKSFQQSLNDLTNDLDSLKVEDLIFAIDNFITGLKTIETRNGLTKQQSSVIQGQKAVASKLKNKVSNLSSFEPVKLDELTTTGSDYLEGVEQGVKIKLPELLKVVKDAGRAMDKMMAISLDEHSPSKKGAEKGKWYLEGIIKGILSHIPLLKNAVNNTSEIIGDISLVPEKDISTALTIPSTALTTLPDNPTKDISKALTTLPTNSVEGLEIDINEEDFINELNDVLATLESMLPDSIPVEFDNNELLILIQNTEGLISDNMAKVEKIINATNKIKPEKRPKWVEDLERAFVGQKLLNSYGTEEKGTEKYIQNEIDIMRGKDVIKKLPSQLQPAIEDLELPADYFEQLINNMIEDLKKNIAEIISSEELQGIEVDPAFVQKLLTGADISFEEMQHILDTGLVDAKRIDDIINDSFDQLFSDLEELDLDPSLIEASINQKLEDFNAYTDMLDYYTEQLNEQVLNESEGTISQAIAEPVAQYLDQFSSAEDLFSSIKEQISSVTDSLNEQFPILGSITQSMGNLVSTGFKFVALQFIGGIFNQIMEGAFEAALQVENLERKLTFSTGKNGIFQLQSIRKEADKLGISFLNAAEGLAQFSASTIGTSLNENAEDIVNKFQKSFAAFGLDTQAQEGAFVALSQIASKGVVSMEELRQQLAERLPGALSAAARSMGMAVPEFLKLVESGQVLAQDLLPAMASQLEVESALGLATSAKSTQAELTRLENNIFTLQAGVGQLPLAIAGLGLPIINDILGFLAKNIQEITIFIGVLAAGLAGNLALSLAGVTAQIIKSVGLISVLKLGLTQLWVTMLPLVGFAAIAATITLGIKSLTSYFTAGSKEIKNYSENLQDLAKISQELKQKPVQAEFVPRLDLDTNLFGNASSKDDYGWSGLMKGTKSFTQATREEFSEMWDFITARSAKAAKKFNDDMANAAKANQAALDIYQSSSTGSKQIDLGNGNVITDNYSVENTAKVRDRLSELRNEQSNVGFQLAFASDQGDQQLIEKLTKKKAELEKEINRVMTEPFLNATVVQKGIEAQDELLKSLNSEKETLIANKNAYSEANYTSRLNTINSLISESTKRKEDLERIDEIRNETIRKQNDLYSKQIEALRNLQKELANINYATSLKGIDSQIDATLQRANGNTSEYGFDVQMRQARSVEVNTKLNLSTTAFNDFEKDVQGKLSKIDPQVKATIAQGIGVNDLDSAILNKQISPEALAQLANSDNEGVKTAIEQSADMKALLESGQQYLTTWQDIKQQQLESANIAKEEMEANKQRNSDIRDFNRSLVDLDVTIADYFRQRQRSLEDFETQYQDVAIQNRRSARDLVEQFNDLGRSLNTQLLQVANQIKQAENDINRRSKIIDLRKELSFGANGLFSNLIGLFDELATSENELQAGQLTLQEERLAQEEEILNIARQIRGLQEQVFDMERQRQQQLRDLIRAQEDWVLQQKSSWLSITRQVEDMERQAKEMGIAFTGIAQHLDGINGSYLEIHNAIAKMADDVKNSANSVSSGMSGGSGITGSGNKLAIGTVGGAKGDPNAGRSTGPHLHFEVIMPDGTRINPDSTEYEKYVTIDGKPLTQVNQNSNFGMRNGRMHKGNDYSYAGIEGKLIELNINPDDIKKVEQLKDPNGWGAYTKVTLQNDYQLLFGHLKTYGENLETFNNRLQKVATSVESSKPTKKETNNNTTKNTTDNLPQLLKLQISKQVQAREQLNHAKQQLAIAEAEFKSAQRTLSQNPSFENRKDYDQLAQSLRKWKAEVERTQAWFDQMSQGTFNIYNKIQQNKNKPVVKPTEKPDPKALQTQYERLRKAPNPTPEMIKERNRIQQELLRLKGISPLSSLNFGRDKEITIDVAFAGVSDMPLLKQLGIPDTLTIPTILDVDNSQLVAQNTNKYGAYEELFKVISSGEGNIESFNRGRSGDSLKETLSGFFGKPLSQITLGEIIAAQTAKKLYAVGRFQFIPDTLKGAVKNTGLPLNTPFTEDTQKELALSLLYQNRPAVAAYLRGGKDLSKAAKSMTDEWISLTPNKIAPILERTQQRLKDTLPYSTGSSSSSSISTPTFKPLPTGTGSLTPQINQLNGLTNKLASSFSTNVSTKPVNVNIKNTQDLALEMSSVTETAVIDALNVDYWIGKLKKNETATPDELKQAFFFKENRDYEGLGRLLESNGVDLAQGKADFLNLKYQQELLRQEETRIQNAQKIVAFSEQQRNSIESQLQAIKQLKQEYVDMAMNAKGYLTYTEELQSRLDGVNRKYDEFQIKMTAQSREVEKLIDTTNIDLTVQKLTKAKEELLAKPVRLAVEDKALTIIDKLLADAQSGSKNILKDFEELKNLNANGVEESRAIELNAVTNQTQFEQYTGKNDAEIQGLNFLGENLKALKSLTQGTELLIQAKEREIDGKYLKFYKEINDAINKAGDSEEARRLTLIKLQAEEFKVLEIQKARSDAYYELAQAQRQSQGDLASFIGEGMAKNNPFSGQDNLRLSKEMSILNQYAEKLKQITDLRMQYAYDPEMLSRLNDWQTQLEELQTIDLSKIEQEISVFAQAIREPINNAFKGLFSDVIKGTKSIQDVLMDFLNSLTDFFANMAAQFASQWFMNMLFPQKQVQSPNPFGGILGSVLSIGSSALMGTDILGGGLGGSAFTGGGNLGIASGITIPTFADGGLVEGINKAMKIEGVDAVPAVLSKGEQVLSKRNGDAQFFRSLEKSGIWSDLKQNYKVNNKVDNFSLGGSVGGVNNYKRLSSSGSQSVTYNSYVNVTTPDANSFRKSKSQIAQEQKLAQERQNRFT